jgi:hypothetical protein
MRIGDMPARQNRPELRAPDLGEAPKPTSSTPARLAPDDPRFAAAAQLETHDAYVRAVQEGRVRVVNPETLPLPPDQDNRARRRRSPETSLSTKVPEYVMQQLRVRYAATGTTIRNQILIALGKDGLQINADDIQDERKRPRR